MLKREEFKCDRMCGKCCKEYIVLLTNSDIKKIVKLGYNEDYFVEYEQIGPENGKTILKKRRNKWCVFLRRNNNGIYSCRIYENRPEICKKYPFFGMDIESCIPVSKLMQKNEK